MIRRGEAPCSAILIHKADFGGIFGENAAVNVPNNNTFAGGFYFLVLGNCLHLFLCDILERTMTIATHLSKGKHFVVGIDGHGNGKQ